MRKEKQKLIQWHPGFCSAVRLELKDNREDLEYANEYNVNRKPIQIDLLVIKKTAEVEINNEIGKMFRGYNIMEYKSPKDALSIDDYFKGLAYACLYKSGGGYVNEIPAEDITISFVREKKPVKLMYELEGRKIQIKQAANGIYYIMDHWFAMQLIVTSELDKKEHLWLRSLTEHMAVNDAERLVYEINGLERKDEKDFADSVLQVAMSANKRAFDSVKKESDVGMCEALRELMAPEIEAELAEAKKKVTEEVTKEVTKEVTESVTKEVTANITRKMTESATKERLTTIKNIMKNLKMDAVTAMSVMGLSEQDQKKYAAML